MHVPPAFWIGRAGHEAHRHRLRVLRDDLAFRVFGIDDILVVLHELGNRLESCGVANPVARIDYRQIDWVVQQVADETTINFQVVHWQGFQIGERTHARAEIIKREFEPSSFGGIDEPLSRVQIGNGGSFSNFKADTFGNQLVPLR